MGRITSAMEVAVPATSLGTILWSPVVKLLKRSDPDAGWLPSHQAALASAIAGRQYSQRRCYLAGWSSHDKCMLCLFSQLSNASSHDTVERDNSLSVEEELWMSLENDMADAVSSAPRQPHVPHFSELDLPQGTLWHRIWDCPCHSSLRTKFAPVHLPESVRQALSAGEKKLLCHGLLLDKYAEVPPPSSEATFQWVKWPEVSIGELETGTYAVYTDGSRLDTEVKCLSRCGWSFVVADFDGGLIASAHGLPPSWCDTITATEAWALHQALGVISYSSSFYTDCRPCVTLLQTPRHEATAADRPLARVFNLLHDHLDSGLSSNQVRWMPAHCSRTMVGVAKKSDGTVLTQIDLELNSLADWLAKSAVGFHRVPVETRDRVMLQERVALDLAKWVGIVTFSANHFEGSIKRDSQASKGSGTKHAPGVGAAKLNRVRSRTRAPALGGHTIVFRSCGFLCTTCRKRSKKPSFAREKCSGSAVQLWASRAFELAKAGSFEGKGHTRAISGDVVWCTVCGLYSEKRTRGIAKPCDGPPRAQSGGRASQLACLRQGLHPRTRVPLPEPILELPGQVRSTSRHTFGKASCRRRRVTRVKRKRRSQGSYIPPAKRARSVCELAAAVATLTKRDELHATATTSPLATVQCCDKVPPGQTSESASAIALSLTAVPTSVELPAEHDEVIGQVAASASAHMLVELQASSSAFALAAVPSGHLGLSNDKQPRSSSASALAAVPFDDQLSLSPQASDELPSATATTVPLDRLLSNQREQVNQVVSTSTPARKKPKLQLPSASPLAVVPTASEVSCFSPYCDVVPGSATAAPSDMRLAHAPSEQTTLETQDKLPAPPGEKPADELSDSGTRTPTSAQQRLMALRLRIRARQQKEGVAGELATVDAPCLSTSATLPQSALAASSTAAPETAPAPV